MEKKYIVNAGYVVSRSDGDKHFITAQKLISLFRVDPHECIIAPKEEHEFAIFERRHPRGQYTWLEPRYDGNYELPKTRI